MLEQTKTGLIVVDVQGKLARMMHDSEQLIGNIVRLIEGCKALDLPIIQLEQIPDKLGATVDEVQAVLATGQAIHKTAFSGCGEPAFLQAVAATQRTQWLVCGIETHICVYQTALQLMQAGHHVELVSDCVGSRTPANKELALAKLVRHGVELSSIEMCLYELMQDCRHPAFRAILPLVK